MTKRWQLVLGGLFFALMALHVVATTWSAVYYLGGGYDGWGAQMMPGGRVMIMTVDPHGPATDLRVGDEFVSLNGMRLPEDRNVLNAMLGARPGTEYRMTVRRDGQPLELTLRTTWRPWRSWFDTIAAKVIIPLIFLTVGCAVFLLKPFDKQARLLALMLGLYVGINQPDLPGPPSWLFNVAVAARVVGLWFLPVFLHFFLVFPERSPLLRRFPRLEFYLYLPFLLIVFPPTVLSRLARIPALRPLNQLIPPSPWLERAVMAVIFGYLIAGLLALFWNYRAADASARRKMRVVVAGSGIGFLSLLLVYTGETFGAARLHPQLWNWLNLSLILTVPLVPLSFAYAIIRHRVIPVSLIIRRSARYVLVSRGSVLLEVAMVWLALTVLLTAVFNRLRPPGTIIGVVSAAVGIMVWNLTRRLHQRYLAPVIDRRFFREAYDTQLILAELAESLRTTTGMPQLLRLVASRIQTALQVESVAVFLRDEATGDYRCALWLDHEGGEGAGRDCHLAGDAGVVRSLIATGRPQTVEPGEVGPPLAELGARLIIPLATKEGTLGLIAVGARLGDLPFSREDERLLRSVAGPASFAIENARLVERMVDHQRKTEELAFARRLQLSLLPKRDLRLGRLEIIGQMRTATEVGGDYYDFIELEDGRYCVAVGDATGHGMAAGLVVGMVKMGLTSALQMLDGEASVKRLVEDVNRSLKRSIAERGMGMCVGVTLLDPATLRAEVCSNGMPFPYHFERGSGRLRPLLLQAPPLGFLSHVPVRTARVQLQAGDALIWLSDGFEERMNEANEIWGGDEVARALEQICREEGDGEGIARRLIAACDAAAGGRSNQDDMTIVVAKVKETGRG